MSSANQPVSSRSAWRIRRAARRYAAIAALSLLPMTLAQAAETIPTPKSVMGHEPGEDYWLANYEQSLEYFHQVDAASDRMMMVKAGTTTQGRSMEYAVISTPENLARWDHWKDVSRRLADSRSLSEAEARALAKDSKIIVHIDGGMHSSEAANVHLPIQLLHTLLTSDSPEIDNILENVVLVLWPTLNPDGMTMISDWYLQNVGGPNETSPMPWLYQEYVGHDNNRDGYMLNMRESQAVYAAEEDYAPAIFYAQHQSAPFPARIWMPPFADPISSNIHPLMRQWTGLIGMHMMADFDAQGLPGAIAQARFDNFYPGFLDYTHVFRHTLSFFTETALHAYATPWDYDQKDFPQEYKDLRSLVMYPTPWKGGHWGIGDAVDYMEVASLSTLDTAVRYRETLLFNRWLAGHGTIERFKSEGPYAWVLPAEQNDAPTAAFLAQKMIDQQIEVYRADRDFSLGEQKVAKGSWVIPMDQPFAGLVQELFETQSYPNMTLDKNGVPENLPYDVTGWTLPMQMGVDVVALSTPLGDGERKRLSPVEKAFPATGDVDGSGNAFLLDHHENLSFKALNAALKAGATAGFSRDGDSIVVEGVDAASMKSIATQVGIGIDTAKKSPDNAAIQAARVGLYRPWRPSMDEGWTRWILEDYGFEPISLHNEEMRAGKLSERIDALVLPDIDLEWMMDGYASEPSKPSPRRGGATVDPVPAKYAGGIGPEGARALRDFVSGGGTLVAFNHAASAAIKVLGLPVENVLEGVGSDEFFCSGALLQTERVETNSAATAGLVEAPIVMFSRGPAFKPLPGFDGETLVRYPAEGPLLRSGVLKGPEKIAGTAAALRVNYGDGEVYLYGFQPQWRAQSLGTYKFVFNPLYIDAPTEG